MSYAWCRGCGRKHPADFGRLFCNKECETRRKIEDEIEDAKLLIRSQKAAATRAAKQGLEIPASYKPKKISKTPSRVTLSEKMKSIKAIGCICPGCLRDFSAGPDWMIPMCFEMCHYHSKYCDDRKPDHYFWGCRDCNRRQHAKCGYYENGQFFKNHY